MFEPRQGGVILFFDACWLQPIRVERRAGRSLISVSAALCYVGDRVRVLPLTGASKTFVSGDRMTAALRTKLVLNCWAARPC